MSIIHFLLAVLLFVVLTPGILVRLPTKGSKWVVAIVHGIIFAVVMHVLYSFVIPNFESFHEGAVSKAAARMTGINKNKPKSKNTFLGWFTS